MNEEGELELREACGIFGCVATRNQQVPLDVPTVISLGLVGLQHRGQESAGIVTTYGKDVYQISKVKGMGLVNQVFTSDSLEKLKGKLGIGHTRYSTAGASQIDNCQPFIVETMHGLISVAHNGELINAKKLKRKVLSNGIGLSTGSDSEIITQILSSSPPDGEPNGPDWPARIKWLMKQALTSYSLVVMHKDVVYAVRDPFGNRPLCIGKVLPGTGSLPNLNECSDQDAHGWIVSSESCSFQAIGASYYREVKPGEIVALTESGVKSVGIIERPDNGLPAFCIFEYVYFSRPDTLLEGQMVYTVRKRCGMMLAREAPVAADLVSTVPESATPAAMGFSKESGIPYAEVLCKNRYEGRTFIQPSRRLRQLGVAKKFGALTDNLKDQRIVLIDDSIVRGNTMAPIVRLLKKSGAKEVHIRVASPPLKYPCYMGINIPTREELIANKMNEENLAYHFGADSIRYLSVAGLQTAVKEGMQDKDNSGHCVACLTGTYPVKLEW